MPPHLEPQPAGPARPQRSVHDRFMQFLVHTFKTRHDILLAAGIAFLLSVWFTFPGILNLQNAYIGDGGDNYEYAAYMGLAVKHIGWGVFPYHPTDFWRYPVGFDFSRGFDSYLTVTIGALLTMMVGLPLSYNLTIIMLMIANGVISYLLFKFITRSKVLGYVGMLMYGFSFYTVAKAASHPNLLFNGGITLYAWSILRFFRHEKITRKDLIIFFASLVLIASGSTLYFIFVMFFTVLYGLLLYYFDHALLLSVIHKIRSDTKTFFKIFGITFVVLLIMYYPHITAIFNHSFVLFQRDKVLYELTPSIFDYFLPNWYLRIFLAKFVVSPGIPSIEKAVFLGWAELAFFVAFFFGRFKRKFKAYMAILFFLPFVLSLGYGKEDAFPILPYRFLSNIFPFNVLVETGRYYVIFYLFITLAVLLFLHSIQRKRLRWALIGTFVILMLLERFPTSFYLSSPLNNEPYVEAVKKDNSQAVLDLPLNPYYAQYDVLSLYYDKAIVNGYFHWSADGNKEKRFIMDEDGLINRYSCSDIDPILVRGMDYGLETGFDIQMLELLKKHNIRTIVIHLDDKFYHPVCKNVRLRLSRLFPYIKSLDGKPESTTPLDSYDPYKEKQIVARMWDGKPSFTFYFPDSGNFNLDGAYFDPSEPAPFTITIDNKPVDFAYNWNTLANGKAVEMNPKYTVKFPVAAGQFIRFSSPQEVGNTFFSLWYVYVPDATSSAIPLNLPLEKIHEDEKAIIYHVN